MRIGIFTDSYRPYTSGVVRSIETFTRELTNLEHEVYIFAPSYPNCEKESRVFRFASVPAPTNRDFSLALPFSLRLKPTIQRLQLDIIHVHSPFLLGRLGARYAKRLGVPLVFTFHTLYDQYVHYVPFGQNITRDITQKLCSDFCNNCDMVITPTAVIGQHLNKIGVKAPIKTVPTGINVDEFNSTDTGWLRQKYEIPNDEKILLCVGRLGQEKNLSFLIKAFSAVQYELNDLRLVLVGGGPEEEILKRTAKQLGVGDRVIFTGTLSRSDVIKCYKGSDLFIFASVTETQGLVIGEAKAAGLPVVAVRAFGVSEMVEDKVDGFLTDLQLDSFVEKIILLLRDNNLRNSMSQNAQFNAQKISSRNCALRLLDSYNDLLERFTLKKIN